MTRPFSRTVSLFLLITTLSSWILALGFYLSGGQWNTPNAFLIALLYMFGPTLGALITLKSSGMTDWKERLGLRWQWNWWLLLAMALPLLFSGLTFAFSLLFPGTSFAPDLAGLFERYAKTMTPEQVEAFKASLQKLPVSPLIATLIQTILAGATINAFFALGEEIGWRGLLLHEWKHLGFWKCSLLTGVIWGLWHLPLILLGHNYPDHPLPGIFMMTLLCMAFAPLLNYIRLKSGSVLAPAIFHGTFNATAGLSLLYIKGGNDLAVGITGAAGILALVLMNAGIFLYNRFCSKETIVL